MATEFDEYEYLEKQLQGGGDAAQPPPAAEPGRERERSHKHRDKDGRSRSRDHDRRRRERSADRGGDRKRYREDRDRRDERRRDERPPRAFSPPKRRERTPPEVREQREQQREMAALERDTRTVFASNLPLRAEEEDLLEFFSKAGEVVDVRIITDRNTRRSKGFAYIEFANKNDVINAISLTGQLLRGQTIMVKMSEAEKNLAWEAAQQAAQQQVKVEQQAALGAGPARLSVSNLHPSLAEADIAPMFEPFGVVMSIMLHRNGVGQSTGAGIVEFAATADAMRAVQDLNGMDIAGQRLAIAVAAPGAPAGEGDPYAGIVAAANATAAAVAPSAPPTDDSLVDMDDSGGGMKLTSQSRAALMARLANSAGVTLPDMNSVLGYGGLPPPPPQPAQAAGPPVDHALAMQQGMLGPASPIPTPCLLLKNMFDPAEETEPTWDQDILNDVKEECSKFGPVVHGFVDKNSQGFVYLKFGSAEAAATARNALNGRWFAGRRIAAEFQFAQIYQSRFGA